MLERAAEILGYKTEDGYRVEVDRPATPEVDGKWLRLIPGPLRGRRLQSITGSLGETAIVDSDGKSILHSPMTLQEAMDLAGRERGKYPSESRVRVRVRRNREPLL